MAQRGSGWVRLTVLLSIVWLTALALWAAHDWLNARESGSPFVLRRSPETLPPELLAEAGLDHEEAVRVQERLLAAVPGSGFEPRFNWGWFLTLAGGGLAAIWFLVLGPVWVAEGFRSSRSEGVSSPCPTSTSTPAASSAVFSARPSRRE